MKYLDEKGIHYKYEEGPGEHDYAFWDKAIERTIEWLVEIKISLCDDTSQRDVSLFNDFNRKWNNKIFAFIHCKNS